MKIRSKLGAIVGAGFLTFALFGIASATPASTDGVTPVLHDAANITIDGKGKPDSANCDAADAVEIDAAGDGTTDNGVTVHMTYDSGTNAVAFTVDGGLVTIAYIKGGNGYNEYDYAGDGVASDGNLFAPDNGSGGPAGLSHAIFCTGQASTPTETPSPSGGGGGETTQPPTDALAPTSGTSGPADTAWLLVVALGVLLASVVVLTPARAKSRR